METLERPLPTEVQDFDRELRLYDDTTTWLAEVLPGTMRTPFEYRFDGRELYARDDSPLEPIFDEAIETARNFGSERSFELRRRLIEKEEYQAMLAMARADAPNTMVVVSDFPPELMAASHDVGGYNVSRKQTMLRVISRQSDGTLLMRSQSLDLSDRAGLEEIYAVLGCEPEPGELLGQRLQLELDEAEQEFLIDRLMGVYDRSLEVRYGGEWYAGRRPVDHRNTYDFVRAQSDLIDAFVADAAFGPDERSLYNLAAAMQARFETPVYKSADTVVAGMFAGDARQEMFMAGRQAATRGTVFSGCGASLGARGENDTGAQDELDQLGFGNKSGEDKYGPLKFKCPKGHWNERKPAKSPKDFLPHCSTCKVSLKC